MALEEIFLSDQMKFIIGFLVGAIIGVERQLSEIRKEDKIKIVEEEIELRPGVRTFGLLSLFGTIATIVAIKHNLLVILYFSLIVSGALISIYTAIKYLFKDYGITTPVALSLSFLLGVLVGVGELTLAITLSVLITFILTSKRYVTSFIRGLEFKEIRSALEIGLLFFLLLPIVPNTVDPIFHAINLRTFYLFLLIVLLLSFMAYISVKKLSPVKGVLTFSAIGALFSSEAVTVNLVRLVKENRDASVIRVTSLGILMANMVMIIRTLALTSILLWPNYVIISELLIFTSAALFFGFLGILFRYLEETNIRFKYVEIESPLSYKTAAKFVFVFAFITFFVIFLQESFSGLGILIGSFLGGFVSNLAVVLSVSSLFLTFKIDRSIAEISIILGTIAAVMNKVIYVWIECKNKQLIKKVILDILLLSIPLAVIASLLLLTS